MWITRRVKKKRNLDATVLHCVEIIWKPKRLISMGGRDCWSGHPLNAYVQHWLKVIAARNTFNKLDGNRTVAVSISVVQSKWKSYSESLCIDWSVEIKVAYVKFESKAVLWIEPNFHLLLTLASSRLGWHDSSGSAGEVVACVKTKTWFTFQSATLSTLTP